LLLAVGDSAVAVVSCAGALTRFALPDLVPLTTALPATAILASLVFDADGRVLAGTVDGLLLRFDCALGLDLPEHVADGPVMLHSLPDGSVVASGAPPFQLSECRIFFAPCECDDIARAGDFLCCLRDGTLSIYAVGTTAMGASRFLLRIPGLVTILSDPAGQADAICLVEGADRRQALVRYSCNGFTARYDHDSRVRIVMVRILDFAGTPAFIIGDDRPTVTLIDAHLRVIAGRTMIGRPTAAAVFAGFLVVARPKALDFFSVKHLDDKMELERRMIAEGPSITRDLAIVGAFLVASDQYHAIAVYALQGDTVVKVAEDPLPKCLNRLAVIRNYVFAATFNGAVCAWRIAEDGALTEMGAFWCDSQVHAFCTVEGRLFYGTAGGGIGFFEETDDEALSKIRDGIRDLGVVLVPDREPPTPFEFLSDDAFIDIDTIDVVRKLPQREVEGILVHADLVPDALEDIFRWPSRRPMNVPTGEEAGRNQVCDM
jgi:hypothetical protein